METTSLPALSRGERADWLMARMRKKRNQLLCDVIFIRSSVRQFHSAGNMGGFPSKFKRPSKVAPVDDPVVVDEPQQKSTDNDTSEEQAVVAEKPKLVVAATDGFSAECAGSLSYALKSSPAIMKAKVLEDFEEIVNQAKKEARVLESAREILAAQGSLARAHSFAAAATPTATTTTQAISLGDTPGSTAFEILLGERRTVSAAARMPRRLRKLEKAPQPTAEDIAKKMKAAEDKRMEALERTRAAAKVKTTKLHPSVELSRNTAQKISDKMNKADLKRSEEIEKKRKTGQRASQAKRKIAATQAHAQEQIKSNIQEKTRKYQMRQVQSAAEVEDKKRRREQHAQLVKCNAAYTVSGEEPDGTDSLIVEADELYCASDGDESWDTEAAALWNDFGWISFSGCRRYFCKLAFGRAVTSCEILLWTQKPCWLSLYVTDNKQTMGVNYYVLILLRRAYPVLRPLSSICPESAMGLGHGRSLPAK